MGWWTTLSFVCTHACINWFWPRQQIDDMTSAVFDPGVVPESHRGLRIPNSKPNFDVLARISGRKITRTVNNMGDIWVEGESGESVWDPTLWTSSIKGLNREVIGDRQENPEFSSRQCECENLKWLRKKSSAHPFVVYTYSTGVIYKNSRALGITELRTV